MPKFFTPISSSSTCWKRGRSSGVVDVRRVAQTRLGKGNEGRQHGGDCVAVGLEPTRHAVMDAVDEALGNERATRAVLRQRGGTRRRSLHTGAPAGKGGYRSRLSIEGSNQ